MRIEINSNSGLQSNYSDPATAGELNYYELHDPPKGGE